MMFSETRFGETSGEKIRMARPVLFQTPKPLSKIDLSNPSIKENHFSFCFVSVSIFSGLFGEIEIANAIVQNSPLDPPSLALPQASDHKQYVFNMYLD